MLRHQGFLKIPGVWLFFLGFYNFSFSLCRSFEFQAVFPGGHPYPVSYTHLTLPTIYSV
jgi:hypothetical protein